MIGSESVTSAWAQASLRIVAEDIEADEISDRLDLTPTTCRISEGEPRFVVWLKESGFDPQGSPADHVMLLIELLRGKEEEISALAEVATVEVWLTFSLGGKLSPAVLPAASLQHLANMHVDLVLEPMASESPREYVAEVRANAS